MLCHLVRVMINNLTNPRWRENSLILTIIILNDDFKANHSQHFWQTLTRLPFMLIINTNCSFFYRDGIELHFGMRSERVCVCAFVEGWYYFQGDTAHTKGKTMILFS